MSSLIIFITALVVVLCRLTRAADSNDWRSRKIYQVMTDRFARTDGSTTAPCDAGMGLYCGGTWQGLINKLDYIQNMGFDAVWISPITKQMEGNTLDGEAYHGYWQQDLYNINPNFGQVSDLKKLANELHRRNMYLMLDIVINHFAWNGSPDTINYGDFNPFNQQDHFHPRCEINYNEITTNATNIEQCWEGDTNVSLPDLRTEDAFVADQFQNWISTMVSNYSVDGLRIDSLMQVNPGFWQAFQKAAGVYSIGEVDDPDVGFVCGFQQYVPGLENYVLYFPLVRAFQSSSGNISYLAETIDAVKVRCSDPSILGSFSENHDVPRFASTTDDLSLAKNVLTFTLLTDGIPLVYQGQEQHYASLGGSNVPFNREALWLSGYDTSAPLYQLVTVLNKARTNAIANDPGYLFYHNWHIHLEDHIIAMRKGQMVTVLTNEGTNAATSTLTLASGYEAGTQVTELLTCETLTADNDGNLAVPMAGGVPRVYYPSSNMTMSGICGMHTPSIRSLFIPRQWSKFWAPPGKKL